MKYLLTFMFAILALAVFSQTTRNSTIAVQPNLQNTVPLPFQPKFRYDTTAHILYARKDGIWKILAEGEGATIFIEANSFYVDPDGNNASGVKGDRNLPFADPWSVLDLATANESTIYLNRGDYVYTGPYSAANQEFSLAAPRKVSIIGPDASISYTGAGLNGDNNWISDLTDNGSFATEASDFKLDVDSLNLSTTDGSLELLIAFYNAESSVDIKANHVNITGSRNWVYQIASPYARLDFGEITTEGNMLGWSQGGIDGMNHIVNVGSLNLGMQGDDIAVVQNNFSGRNQYVNTSIGVMKGDSAAAAPNSGVFYISSAGSTASTNILNIGKLEWVFDSPAHGVNDWRNGASTAYQQTSVLTSVGDSTNHFVNIKDMVTNVPVLGTFGARGETNNSTIHLKFEKLSMSGPSPGFYIGNMDFDSTKLIIECIDCEHSGTGSFFWIENNTLTGGSEIIVKGNFRQKNGGAIINTRNDITFIGTVENDGTAAAIQSDQATTVYVSGAFDANPIILDPDITFVRLDEYGAASGADGNGIYSASGTIPTAVDAQLTDNFRFLSAAADPLLSLEGDLVTVGGNDNTSSKYMRIISDVGANGMTHQYFYNNQVGIETASNTTANGTSHPRFELYRRGSAGLGVWPDQTVAPPSNSIVGQFNYRSGIGGGGSNTLFSLQTILGTDITTGTKFQINDDNDATFNTFLEIDRGSGSVRFPKYGVGTITGTPTYAAAFDGSGNIIEMPLIASDSGTPTAGSGFTVAGASVSKEGDIVCLAGHIGATSDDTAITSGVTTILTLPAGFRPGTTLHQNAFTNQIADDLGQAFVWQINTDGTVKAVFIGGDTFDLDAAESMYLSGCFSVN